MARIIKNNLGNLLVILGIFLVVACWIYASWPQVWQEPPLPPEVKEVKASPDTATIEQQINIINQEYTHDQPSWRPSDNSLGLIKWDGTKYSDETVYFEAVIKASNVATCYASLFDKDGPGVGDWVFTSSLSYTRVRTGSPQTLTDGKEYTARVYSGTGGSTCYIKAARLIIVQSTTTGIISNTETQVEVGDNATTSNTSYTDLTNKKIYKYDADVFDPAPTINFQATLKGDEYPGPNASSGPTDCVIADNDSSTGTEAWLTPSSGCGVDGYANIQNIGNAASYYLKATTSAFNIPAGNTIKGISVGVQKYQTLNANNDVVDSAVRIVKGGNITGINLAKGDDWPAGETTIYYGSSTESWGESWQVSDINDNFGVAISAKDKGIASKPVDAYINNITFTVYYTEAGGTSTASAILYDITSDATIAGSEVSVGTTTWSLARTSSSFSLTDEHEYSVQIKSSNSNSTTSIANAKIILTQASSTGIDAVEIIHQYVNTATTTSNTSYERTYFDNEYNPNNWAGGTFNHYFEATMKKSYADLATNTTQIINSEISTTSASYVRVRSADVLTMPGSATNTDTRIHSFFCDQESDYNSTSTVSGDLVYCDNSGRLWTPTAIIGGSASAYSWGPSQDEGDDSCIAKGSSYAACNYCDILTYAGYSNWELPSCVSGSKDSNCILYQFGIDACGSYPCTPSWDTNTKSDFYWSSTEYSSNNAWSVHFDSGNVDSGYTKGSSFWVRCVHGQ